MKKFLLIVMAVAVTGSFTSCVENEIPDEVTAIYDNQADLLAAQAALATAQAQEAAARALAQQAQAAFTQAQADVQAAMAEAQRIANEQATAANAIMLEQMRAQADAAIARAELQAEQDRIAALQAQLQWEQTQQALQAAIAAAQEQAVQNAYTQYLAAVTQVQNFTRDEINDRKAVLDAMNALNAGVVNDANAMADLEANVAGHEAEIARLEAEKADLEALLASGDVADYNAQLEAYEARVEEIDAAIDATLVDKQLADDALTAAQQVVADANNDVTATGADTFMADFAALQTFHNTVLFGGMWDGVTYNGLEADRDAVTAEEANVEAQEDLIEDLQDIVDNYDTKLADFEAALAAAEAAEDAAEDALDAAEDAEDLAEAAHDAAIIAVGDAQSDLAALQLAAAAANASLDVASAALAAAIAAQTDETPFVTAVSNAEALVVQRQNEYDAAKAIFDADPAGSTVVDGGADGVIGNDGDASTESFREILTVNGAGEATFGATVYTSVGTIPGGAANVSPNGWGTFNNTDVGLYYDVEADDAPPVNNITLLQNAADALDAAKAAVPVAEQALATVRNNNDITDEQEDYDEAAAFFASAEADVAAAEAAVTAAQAAEVAAAAAEAAAEAAETAAAGDLADAQADTNAAQADLNNFNNSTETEYQDQLQGAIADLEFINDALAEAIETRDANIALSDELAAQIDAGPQLNAEQQAAVDALAAAEAAEAAAQAEVDAIDAITDPLNDEKAQVNSLITILEGILNVGAAGDNSREAIQMLIDGLNDDIADEMDDLKADQDAITNFVGGVAALQTALELAEATYDNTVALLAAWEARAERRLEILQGLL